MKVFFALIVLICVHVTVNADVVAQNCALSTDRINNEIKQDGAKKTLFAITHDGRWKSLLACIATGQPDWVAIDAILSGYADGHEGEEFGIVLGEALGSRPADVLRVTQHHIGTGYSLHVICSGPDLDDIRFSSYDLAVKEIDRRERALATVTDKDLLNDVKACHDDLEKSKKWDAHVFGLGPDLENQSTNR